MANTSTAACPLCGRDAQNQTRHDQIKHRHLWRWECTTCGIFDITELAQDTLLDNNNKFHWLSAYAREKTIQRNAFGLSNKQIPVLLLLGPVLFPGDVSLLEAEQAFPATVGERLDRTLQNLAWLTNIPGKWFSTTPNDYVIAYGEDAEAGGFVLSQLLHRDLVEIVPDPRKVTVNFFAATTAVVRLTAKGWDRVDDLKRGKLAEKPNQAFVAMWFSAEVQAAFTDGLKKGIMAAGYSPMRIDNSEHNNKIDDEIIAEIRKSRFLVADFTGSRGGVYFEAGFAVGLGMPVIWTCRKDKLDTDLHFDTRQYNHIDWQTPAELAERLQHRIEATIGRGTLSV
jgi:hypothetical protein